MGEGVGEKPHFTPYGGDLPTLPEKLTPERASHTAKLVAERMDYLRDQFPRATVTSERGLSDYLKTSEKNLRNEFDERPKNSIEYLVAAAYHAQRAMAAETYLNTARALPEHARSYLEVYRNTAHAEAQQSVVNVLLMEKDPRTMAEAVRVYSAVSSTPWHASVYERLEKIRSGALSETQQAMSHGLARGVAGHAAAVRLAVAAFDRPQRAYAPSPELDGMHGIDFGLHPTPPQRSRINTVIQVKAKERLDDSIIITPTASDPSEPYSTTYRREDIPNLPLPEQLAAKRELDIRRLDRGAARLPREFGHLVDQRLIGLFIELRAAPAGKSPEQIKQAPEGQFDIFTGLCNDALRTDAKQEYNRIMPEIEVLRSRLGQAAIPRRRPLRRHKNVP